MNLGTLARLFCALFASALALLGTAEAAHAKQTVCTATVNSSEEREVFMKRLSPDEFEFVELLDFASNKEDRSRDWFQNACASGLKCDVLIVSGHFGGNFFGKSGFTLELSTLESNSCQNRCPGILSNPKEVYLFGCNTLAGKAPDHRTQAEYVEVLVADDIDRTEAERIAAARYSPIGSSFGDRMMRIFENVPLIYGYTSVGPSGANVKATLDKYLTGVGDYSKHLSQIGPQTKDNPGFMTAMTRHYPAAIASGVTPESPAYAVKQNACPLQDEQQSTEAKVATATRLLEMDTALYFPAVSDYLRSRTTRKIWRQQTQDPARQALLKLSRREDLRDQMFNIIGADGMGISLTVDAMNLARSVRWITSQAYTKRMKELLGPSLHNPTVETADLVCSFMNEEEAILYPVTLKDVEKADFTKTATWTMLSCLTTKDTAILRRLLDATAKLRVKSPEAAAHLIMALTRLPGFESEAAAVVDRLNDSNDFPKEFIPFLQVMKVSKLTGEAQAAFVRETFTRYEYGSEFFLLLRNLYFHKEIAMATAQFLIEQAERSGPRSDGPGIYFGNFPKSAEFDNWIAANWSKWSRGTQERVVHALMNRRGPVNSAQLSGLIVDLVLSAEKHAWQESELAILDRSPLTQEQNMKLLRMLRQDPNSPNAPMLRAVLFRNRQEFKGWNHAELNGRKSIYSCEQVSENYSECFTRQLP